MENKNHHKWSKDKLVAEIKTLLKRKKFGIVWEDKEEEVVTKCEHVLPVLRKVENKKIQNNKSDLQHIIIEGDNYHALSILCYTHKKKVDVIYIDPPYNTGNEDFVYNDNYIDKEDGFRHSKWLSFMKKRLDLAKKLLRDNGAIFISIDDNEFAHLRLLCNEVFGENNFVTNIIWKTKKGAQGMITKNMIVSNHEYILVYAKDISKFSFLGVDRNSEGFGNPDNDKRGLYKRQYLQRKGQGLPERIITDPETSKQYKFESPYTQEKLNSWVEQKRIIFPKNGMGYPARKEFFNEYKNKQQLTTDFGLFSTKAGTESLYSIFEGKKVFNNPKPMELIKFLLKTATESSAIILDFFAGSGTTGHAVMELNKEDGGKRQFILCTNNENNNDNGSGGVAEAICYPRIEKVMNGYINLKKQKIDGLGGNLRYYKTDFVNQVGTDTDKRKLVNKSTEMLCLIENTFNRVLEEKELYAVFENSERMMGIIYDEDAIDNFVEDAKKLKKPLVVYVFSYNCTYYEEDFADIKNLLEVKPIPGVILNVYRRIYKNIRNSEKS